MNVHATWNVRNLRPINKIINSRLNSTFSTLHLNCSIGSDSVTHRLSELFISRHHEALRRMNKTTPTVKEVDLWDKKILQETLQSVSTNVELIREGKSPRNDRQSLLHVDQLLSSNLLLISCPLWNYSIPYVLKQYIDCVMLPGITFVDGRNGSPPHPMKFGRPLILLTSAGGFHSPKRDYQIPLLKDVFYLAGFTNFYHVSVKKITGIDDASIAFSDASNRIDNLIKEIISMKMNDTLNETHYRQPHVSNML